MGIFNDYFNWWSGAGETIGKVFVPGDAKVANKLATNKKYRTGVGSGLLQGATFGQVKTGKGGRRATKKGNGKRQRLIRF